MLAAFFAGDIADTVIEAINKIGSVFYGPILATFLAAIAFKRTHFIGANVGILVGVLTNVYLWQFQPDIFWFWWNAIGAAVTLTVSILVSAIIKVGKNDRIDVDNEISVDGSKATILLAFAASIILFSYFFPSFF